MARECMVCHRAIARSAQPRMVALPRDRAVQALAMSQVGINIARPLFVRVGRGATSPRKPPQNYTSCSRLWTSVKGAHEAPHPMEVYFQKSPLDGSLLGAPTFIWLRDHYGRFLEKRCWTMESSRRFSAK
ncbi:hypothetical protein T06_8640 [Trichinella sp. T6]|nr:hypothetical protein T06_8640 [Trichinella sp. T6]